MKKLFFAICIAVGVSGLQSCVYVDSNEGIPPRGTSTRTFDFKNFTKLEMGNAFQVHVTQGNTYEVSATGEQNDLDDLQIFVQDGELVVRYENKWSGRRQRVDLDIVMPSLEKVDFSGAVNSDLVGFENLEKIEFELSGASKCDFDGVAKNMIFDLSGASQLDLFGESKYLDGELSGASQINAFNLSAEESDIDLAGASTAKVWIVKYLNVDASGASSVRYKGNPTVKKQLSGGSTLRQE